MKRFALTLALSGVLTGCWSDPASTPSKASSPAHSTVASPVAERKLKGYFELKQDGKTYVMEDFGTMTKVKTGEKTGTWSPDWTDVNGKTVALQDDGAGLASALKKEYEKSHPKIETK